MTVRIIPAIMSGGAGTRLWPLSTESKPKQFHALMGPRTMFAETVARLSGDVSGISFAPPMVLCGESHLAPARAALAEVDARAAVIVVEPAARNTAAVAAAAAFVAQDIDADALVLLAPSDHVIGDTAAFHNAIARSAPFARDRIVTFGMTPTTPATGYGYIKRGAPLGDGVFAIEAFKEKPDEATARTYLETGDYSWNSGMFLFSPATLLAEFQPNAAIRERAREALSTASRSRDEIRLGAAYAEAQSLPLDIAVMECTTRAAVAPCDIGWADVGSWAEVWRLTPRDADGFAVLGPAASTDTSKMIASGVKAVAIDGDDLVVIATPDGFLIAPRARVRDRDALRRAAQEF
jgi:mannose-1-phosphate guanylyltransferase/mannose-6-phosphate isomerase